MKIISTNIGKPTTFMWNGKEETTGIFKKPTHKPIYLSKNDVVNDEVTDRLHHGGFYKAIYLFGSDIDDEFKLLELPENKITVAELFHLMYAKEKNQDLLKMASECNAIPHKKRMFFSKFIK